MSEQELQTANALYRADLARAKSLVKQEMNTRIAELTKDSLIALSKVVHTAHSSGKTKATINALLGVYSNVAQARPIWDAFTPVRSTDLRVRKSIDSGDSIPDVTVERDKTDLKVEWDGYSQWVLSPVLHQESDDEWVDWIEPSAVELGDDYSAVYQAVYSFLKAEEKE